MSRRKIRDAMWMGAQIAALVVLGVVATGMKAAEAIGVCGKGKRRKRHARVV